MCAWCFGVKDTTAAIYISLKTRCMCLLHVYVCCIYTHFITKYVSSCNARSCIMEQVCATYITLCALYFDNVQDEKELYQAARSGDVEAVKRLVAANVNVDCTPLSVCDTIHSYNNYYYIVDRE